MDSRTNKNRIIRVALIAVTATSLAGCAAAEKAGGWLTGKRSAKTDGDVILGAPAVDTYLTELHSLAIGDPATKARIYTEASAAARLTPDPSTRLRLGLVLATPGHSETDPGRAEQLLNEVLSQMDLLTDYELALATTHLNSVEHMMSADAENRRLRESTSSTARSETQAINERLASVEVENESLRRQLADAEQKLEAITSIERSIREQE